MVYFAVGLTVTYLKLYRCNVHIKVMRQRHFMISIMLRLLINKNYLINIINFQCHILKLIILNE